MVGENVRIAMSEPTDLKLNTPTKVTGLNTTIHFVNTGVPHAVSYLPDADSLDALDVFTIGRAIRRHEDFAPAGTNANFATVLSPGHIRIRTYERGVEDETLSCGTGAVAAALVAHTQLGLPSPVVLDARGGQLEVSFSSIPEGFTNIVLTGPVARVFDGEWTA